MRSWPRVETKQRVGCSPSCSNEAEPPVRLRSAVLVRGAQDDKHTSFASGVDRRLENRGPDTAALERRSEFSQVSERPSRRGAPEDPAGPGFTKLVKWRTCSEARISCLKRDYQWRGTRIDGLAGTQTWCGWGVLAHNATKISGLIATRDKPSTMPAKPTPRHPPTGPPNNQSAIAA